MRGIRIRRATLRDLDILVMQRRQMFEEMSPFTQTEHAVGDREYRRWVRRLLPRGSFVAWIGWSPSDAPVAGGAVWLVDRQPRPGRPAHQAPYLLSMYTDPAFRGRGIASRIVKEAMRWAKLHGYSYMTLHASRQGRRLYSKLKWKRTWEMAVKL
jgi:GNAT superfamily N-acetyltransferase